MADSHKLDGESAALSKFKLFTGFKEDELASMLALCDAITFQDGERIISQDEENGLCMYVLVAGSVRVHYNSANQEVELARLGVGDFFGELALVDDGPRSASVTAIGETRVVRISRMVVGVLAGIKPAAAIHLLAAIGRSLVNRLRTGNQKYLDLTLLAHEESKSAAD